MRRLSRASTVPPWTGHNSHYSSTTHSSTTRPENCKTATMLAAQMAARWGSANANPLHRLSVQLSATPEGAQQAVAEPQLLA
jgi:hypothetical protein